MRGQRDARRGAAIIEYVLLLALFVLAVAAALPRFTRSVDESASRTGSHIGQVPAVPITNTTRTTALTSTTASTTTTTTAPSDVAPLIALLVPTGSESCSGNPIEPGSPAPISATVTDSDTPMSQIDLYWDIEAVWATNPDPAPAHPGPGGLASLTATWQAPGTRTVQVWAFDGTSWAYDSKNVKVSSGVVQKADVRLRAVWVDATYYRVKADVSLVNQYGNPVAYVDVAVQFTYSSGGSGSSSDTCTTDGNGTCTAVSENISRSIGVVTVRVTGLSGGCFDSWTNQTVVATAGPGTGTPPSTSTSTTTTRPASTTTTSSTSTTATTTTTPTTTTGRTTTTTTPRGNG